MIRFTLSWPDKRLSPNARKDRRAISGSRRKAFEEGFFEAYIAIGGLLEPLKPPLHVSHTFRPPDKRRVDADNLLGATKYHRDGIAKAIGIDDRHWSVSARISDPAPPHGRVDVEISGRAE